MCFRSRLGSNESLTSFISVDFLSALTGLTSFFQESIPLHVTWQECRPYKTFSREQVTISAFNAHSYMKLVPDLGSLWYGHTGCKKRREGTQANIGIRPFI